MQSESLEAKDYKFGFALILMNNKEAFYLVLRYLVLALFALNGLSLIYFISRPLTIYPSYFLLNLIYPDATLSTNFTSGAMISFGSTDIMLINACIAGSAYFFLLMLNLSTPMGLKKRALNLSFILVIFLILNLIRIVIFSMLFASGFRYFDLSHQLTWYFGSTLMLIILWFAGVFLFKIEDIPVYTDIKSLVDEVFNRN